MKKSLLLLFLFMICCSKTKKDESKISINKNENWIEYNTKDSIPSQLKDVLFSINGETKIANRNEEFEATDNIMDSELPTRQLRLLSKKNTDWRMSYKQGGIGTYYVYIQCKIENDSLYNLKIAHSLYKLENNDSITNLIKKGRIKWKKIKISYK